jgi:hypothetical protein
MGAKRQLLLLMTAGLLPPVSATAQGLGDAAKRQKQQRERAAPVPSKTYTQDDLKALPPVANEGSSRSAEAGASTGSAPPAQETERQPADNDADKRAQDERMWRSRVDASRERVELTRQRYEALAARGGDPRWALRGLRTDLVDPKVIAAAKADLDAAQKALDDLLEEARRANVPPGWLR